MSWYQWRNKPIAIIIHHTAVSYDKNADQFKATKNYHIKKGWGDIGYHYEIAKSGKPHKGRDEKTPGAHCYQQGMNYKSIGIALDGNFNKVYLDGSPNPTEMPTPEQMDTLTLLLKEIMTRYNIPIDKLYMHRDFATYKDCAGSKLDNNWLRDLVRKNMFDQEFAKKWEGNFILDVDDKGKVYYIKGGKRIYVSPKTKLRDFVNQKGLVTGFKHKDVERIESAD